MTRSFDDFSSPGPAGLQPFFPAAAPSLGRWRALSVLFVSGLALAALVWTGVAGAPPGSRLLIRRRPPVLLKHPTSKTLTVLMVRQLRPNRLPPLSLLDLPPKDDGLAGARLAIDDNNTNRPLPEAEFYARVDRERRRRGADRRN